MLGAPIFKVMEDIEKKWVGNYCTNQDGSNFSAVVFRMTPETPLFLYLL